MPAWRRRRSGRGADLAAGIRRLRAMRQDSREPRGPAPGLKPGQMTTEETTATARPEDRPRRAARDRGPRAGEDLPDPDPPRRLAQGAGRAAVLLPRLPDPPRPRRRLVRHPPGRVLRHRRAQRLGQEHAAEVPRQHLPGRRRDDPDGGPAGALHRARGRLQRRADRARKRRPQRGDDGADEKRDEAPARLDRRFRRTRRVHRPEAEELLLGDARPARLLADDAGRRRRAADRRGPRRRRRRLPAEVRRRLPRHESPGEDDRPRHPLDGHRQDLLRPGDADRRRRPCRGSATRPRSATSTCG